ncbi:MAG: dodecin family protein [Anaerolineales bacterium]|nr:dodecin family protein [Anaerolineales bacterium]MCS7247547.1 dodecin family protein [Anaerolineales bacterium]MDW8161358.1 dodecin family protein [Anaerolineales bacterium]MDW8447085.1 dodecin family protein [Anaerolineales bacterium]
MANPVYKKIEIIGTSPVGIEDAVQNALKRAAQTVREMRWIEVVEIRGRVDQDHVDQWQVTVKIGFNVLRDEDDEEEEEEETR